MGSSISPLMCRAISLADSTSTRPSLVLLLLERPEDFRKGFLFGVTEVLLFVLGIYGDEIYGGRGSEIVDHPQATAFAVPGSRPPRFTHAAASWNERVVLRVVGNMSLHFVLLLRSQQLCRSEERRVGKECR